MIYTNKNCGRDGRDDGDGLFSSGAALEKTVTTDTDRHAF